MVSVTHQKEFDIMALTACMLYQEAYVIMTDLNPANFFDAFHFHIGLAHENLLKTQESYYSALTTHYEKLFTMNNVEFHEKRFLTYPRINEFVLGALAFISETQVTDKWAYLYLLSDKKSRRVRICEILK